MTSEAGQPPPPEPPPPEPPSPERVLPEPVLPDVVRRAVLELAATAVGALAEHEVPALLRRVRSFAPARRARAAAGPLAVALERDPAFRQRVAQLWSDDDPDLAAALERGGAPAAADPGAVLAGLFLLRPAGWEETARAVLPALAEARRERDREASEGQDAQRLSDALAEVDRLRGELAGAVAASASVQDELAAGRRELRRARSDADRARAALRAAVQEAEQARREAAELVRQAQDGMRRAGDEAREAREQADAARRSSREGRALADARLRLLLDTVVEAATGLRRELALPPVPVTLPGDVVAAAATGRAEGPDGGSAPRGLVEEDPALLGELLALPQSHLVVDGYNVTKAGYGSLPLAEQRRRLVDALAALAARTASEVTCVFDGAEVEARGATRSRGVRVLFSDPGTTADEVVRRLVRAEPPGRPVVVVSSDREVASGVRAAGARAVPSQALLRLLARA